MSPRPASAIPPTARTPTPRAGTSRQTPNTSHIQAKPIRSLVCSLWTRERRPGCWEWDGGVVMWFVFLWVPSVLDGAPSARSGVWHTDTSRKILPPACSMAHREAQRSPGKPYGSWVEGIEISSRRDEVPRTAPEGVPAWGCVCRADPARPCSPQTSRVSIILSLTLVSAAGVSARAHLGDSRHTAQSCCEALFPSRGGGSDDRYSEAQRTGPADGRK